MLGFSNQGFRIPGTNYYVDPTPGFNAPNPVAVASRVIYGGGNGATIPDQTPKITPAKKFSLAKTIDGSGTSPAVSQAQAKYDQAIGNTQAAINRLPNQQKSGYSAIDAYLNNALNQLLLSKNQGQTAYDTNKQQSATDFVGTKNTIGANAGNTLNGLLRLLGSRGAGGSSAYNIGAPQAVARDATLQRTTAGNTFGANNRALDTNWNNFLTGYRNEVSGAKNQRNIQRQDLADKIATKRASLLQTLSDLSGKKASASGGNAVSAAQPYLNQANAVLDRASNYKVKPITFKTQAYNAPSLASYTTNKVTPTYEGGAPANDYFSPYLSALLGDKRRQTVGA